MFEMIFSLVIGFGFGFALQKAGLGKYHKIVNVFRFTDLAVLKFMMTTLAVSMVNVFRFTDLAVLKFMMTTLAVSMVGVFALNSLGIVALPNIPATYIVGNLIGGLIFGVGMSGAGF